jgi:hypothetical protein
MMIEALKKLSMVQHELKAPKAKQNTFGKYAYRSCEDILEAVKPVLSKHGAVIVLSDEVVIIPYNNSESHRFGKEQTLLHVRESDRVYVKSTATFYDCESGQEVSSVGYARESYEKKGMDDAQLTGSCSSYARKYALNALLLIDDTKDADSDETIQASIAWANNNGKTSEELIAMMEKKNGRMSEDSKTAIRKGVTRG